MLYVDNFVQINCWTVIRPHIEELLDVSARRLPVTRDIAFVCFGEESLEVWVHKLSQLDEVWVSVENLPMVSFHNQIQILVSELVSYYLFVSQVLAGDWVLLADKVLGLDVDGVQTHRL